jgi:hypothetical protein
MNNKCIILILSLLFSTPVFAQVDQIQGESKEYLNQQLRDIVGRMNDVEEATTDLTSEVTGILPLANGGTGQDLSSNNQGDIYYDGGTNGFTRLTPGTDGQFLQTQGASANPQWADATSPDVVLVEAKTLKDNSWVTFSGLTPGTSYLLLMDLPEELPMQFRIYNIYSTQFVLTEAVRAV